MNKKINSILFKSHSIHTKDSVVLNWHTNPIEEFGVYAEAYHKAAVRLVTDYGTTGAVKDIEATPILFLYRHAFELYLKAFIIKGSKILKFSGQKRMSQKEIFKTHKLSRFTSYFEDIIHAAGWTWDMGIEGFKNKSDFENLVQEFEKIDPDSYSFRYPTKTDGKDALPCHFTFNLSEFSHRIDPLLELLDGALSGLDDALNYHYEAEQN